MARVGLLGPGSTAEHILDLIEIATAVFTAAPWGEAPATAGAAALRLIAERDANGFVGALATLDGRPCGFAYAVRARHLETLAGADPAATEPLELRELAVTPASRGLGVGAALHDALVRDTACPKWLSTHPCAHPAVALYRSRGWQARATVIRPLTGPRLLMSRIW